MVVEAVIGFRGTGKTKKLPEAHRLNSEPISIFEHATAFNGGALSITFWQESCLH
jgi:hypothetical protein